MQLILFFLMEITLFLVAQITVTQLVPMMFGVGVTQVESIGSKTPYGLVVISQYVQGYFSLLIFLVPALLFAYLTHPSPSFFLGLRRPGKAYHWLLVIFIMIGAIPVLEGIADLMHHLKLGSDAASQQQHSDEVSQAYMHMPAITDFLRTFIVMAIIPALGEEVFFRGIFMRYTIKVSRKLWTGIIFSAAIFAFSHANIYGLPSIFLAGVLLAGIYYLTGSLLCSMLAHMCFNGLQIVLIYATQGNKAATDWINNSPLWLIFAGAAVFAVSFGLLWRTRTPLSHRWTNDFNDMSHIQPNPDNPTE